jgi:hypothetical protein
MSYSFSVPPGPAEELRERAEKAAADYKATVPLIEEADRDIAAAIDAAERLASSISDLAPGVEVTASISGHANPGRGYPGTDSVSVYVTRVSAEAPASPS